MSILLTVFAVAILLMGIVIFFGTIGLAIWSAVFSWWDERTTQGTIILTTMGVFMIVFSSSALFL